MLSARAYSFRQKSRLAISLSWVGGYSNVIAFVACGSYASHVTGVTTNIGSYVAESDWMRALLGGLLWLSFFAGAVASALLTESARRRGMASKYIQPMALEMALLSVFAIGLRYADPHSAAALYRLVAVVSFAMGLQNATITKISGAVIRTTHLTGVTTDLGLEGTQFLLWCRDQIRGRRWSRAGRVLKVSQRHPSFLRVLLLASIIGSFLFGAVAGAFCYIHMGPAALVLPVVFLGAIVWIDYRKPIADVKEIDLLGDAELKLFGIVQALLPRNLGIWRVSRRPTALVFAGEGKSNGSWLERAIFLSFRRSRCATPFRSVALGISRFIHQTDNWQNQGCRGNGMERLDQQSQCL